MDERLKVIGESTNVRVILDNEVLLEKIGIHGNWKYVHEINGQLTYECINRFNQKYFNIFIINL